MFERLRRVQPAESKLRDQVHMSKLLGNVGLNMEARLDGLTITARDLLSLKVDDVLVLDAPVEQKITALLNGEPKFLGDVGVTGAKLGFRVDSEREQD
jgi:flagellar motor switch protein FliM